MTALKGALITIEGIEGCGKTTQSRLLAQRLVELGKSVIYEREPGGTEIGDKIRSILLDVDHTEMDAKTEALLYAASRSQLINQVIQPALAQGRIIILDRYIDSTFAYQIFGRGLDGDIIRSITDWIVGDIIPDMTILLELDVDTGMARLKPGQEDRIENEDKEFHTKVARGFRELAGMYQERFRIVDGSQPIDVIHDRIMDLVAEAVSFNA